MSKLDLKAAMDSLQVKKPLKLQAKQPQFKAPTLEAPQNELAQKEVANNEVPRIEAPQPVVAQNKGPQSELPKNVLAKSEVPQKELTQKELPQIEAAEINGFFKLPHAAFYNETMRALTGDEFRLFLWMSSIAWRFKDSTGELRASIKYVEVGTGMSHASVSRALKRLKDQGLIQLQESDYKRGNLWRVSNKLTYLEVAQIETPQNELAQNDVVATSKRASSSLKTREEPPQNEAQLRNTRIKENKNSLSVSNWAEAYFESILAPAKCESEREAFLKLKQNVSDTDLERCFAWIRKHGDLASAALVHSPMAYLAQTCTEVLTKVRAEQSARAKRIAEQQQAIDKRNADASAALTEHEASEQAIRAFETKYPDPRLRENLLNKFVAKELNGVRPPIKILIGMMMRTL